MKSHGKTETGASLVPGTKLGRYNTIRACMQGLLTCKEVAAFGFCSTCPFGAHLGSKHPFSAMAPDRSSNNSQSTAAKEGRSRDLRALKGPRFHGTRAFVIFSAACEVCSSQYLGGTFTVRRRPAGICTAPSSVPSPRCRRDAGATARNQTTVTFNSLQCTPAGAWARERFRTYSVAARLTNWRKMCPRRAREKSHTEEGLSTYIPQHIDKFSLGCRRQ